MIVFDNCKAHQIWVLRSEIWNLRILHFMDTRKKAHQLAQLKTIMFSRLKLQTDFWLSFGVEEKSTVKCLRLLLLIDIKLLQFPNAHRDNLVPPSLFRQMQQTGFWPSVVQSIGAGRRKLSDSSIAYTPPAVLLLLLDFGKKFAGLARQRNSWQRVKHGASDPALLVGAEPAGCGGPRVPLLHQGGQPHGTGLIHVGL